MYRLPGRLYGMQFYINTCFYVFLYRIVPQTIYKTIPFLYFLRYENREIHFVTLPANSNIAIFYVEGFTGERSKVKTLAVALLT